MKDLIESINKHERSSPTYRYKSHLVIKIVINNKNLFLLTFSDSTYLHIYIYATKKNHSDI